MSEKRMKNKNRIILIGIAAVLLVALVVVYFAVFRKKAKVAFTEITEQINTDLMAPKVSLLCLLPILRFLLSGRMWNRRMDTSFT